MPDNQIPDNQTSLTHPMGYGSTNGQVGAITTPSTVDENQIQPQDTNKQPTTPVAPSQQQVPTTTQDSTQKQVEPNKITPTSGKPVNLADSQFHPHATWLRGVAETLAGGPRYKTTYDAVTGEAHREKIPLSKGDIGMAIAASVLQGAIAGLQQHGPNHSAQAAGAGFAATAQARQQQDLEQQQQDQRDYARKVSIVENNMKAYQNAIQFGRLGKEDHDTLVSTYADQLDRIKTDTPELIGDDDQNVSEAIAKDMKKYPLDQYTRIPDGTTPRIDPTTGKQAVINGIPQWDNTYTMVKKGAKEQLVGTDGDPRQWVKDAVSWGLPGFPSSLLEKGISPNTSLSAETAFKTQHELAMLHGFQSELNSFAKSLGIESTDLKAELKADPGLLTALKAFQRTSGMSTQPDLQIDAMRQNPKTQGYAYRIQQLFGLDNLEKFKQDRVTGYKVAEDEAKKQYGLVHPKTEADATATLGEFTKAGTDKDGKVIYTNKGTLSPQQQAAVDQAKGILGIATAHAGAKAGAEEEARQNAQKAGLEDTLHKITIAPYIPVPQNAQNMNAEQYKQYLTSQNAFIPDGYDALYAAGHDYAMDRFNQTFPTRVSAKTGQMDAETATSYIRKFINPQFDPKKGPIGESMLKQLTNPKDGLLITVGTASQHLNLLREAAIALRQNDTQALNRIGRFLSVQLGDDPYTNFEAINDKVNAEVAKVVSGGQPRVGELEEQRKNLSSDQSDKQINGVINAYTNLMGGRLDEVNTQFRDYFPYDIHVSDTVNRLFQKNGTPTPWTDRTYLRGTQNGKTYDIVKDKSGKIISATPVQ